MRLHLLLPQVEPKAIPMPSKCAYADCPSKQVRLHQPVQKALRDTAHQQVEVHRYRCLKCGRTFRVYPPGVSHAQSSDRVKGLAVLLYLLGLSYGAVSLAKDPLGRGTLQDGSLRDGTSGRRPRPRTQARASLPRSQDQSLGGRFDECEMCRAMAASGSDR